MDSIEIAPNIYWVGSIDWNVREFHGYSTHRGTSYNAYLIVDEKVALIDTVKEHFGEDMLAKIAERIDPAKIDYIVSNHTEPDHSGEIARVLEHAPHATVVANQKGHQGLQCYYPEDWNYQVVKTGDTISLGQYTLQFINTPMLHWPDSMFTYIPEQKILFSMDAFGQHYATSQRFDDEVPYDELMMEAKTYYANIIMHLGNVVSRTLREAAELDIDMILTSHGISWRKHIPEILAAYKDWATFKARPKILVIYDSMWHSTEIMAQTITSAATQEGVEVKMWLLTVNDLTDLAREMLDTAAIAVGSPTLNNNLMPTVAGFLTYIKGLRPKNKSAVVFGSYGWSGEGVPQAKEFLKQTGFELIGESIRCRYRPDEDTLAQCRQAGRELAKKALESVK